MNIITYNAAWQFPARTEYAAFIAAKQLDPNLLRGATYLAFPWATLIDSFQSSQISRWDVLQSFILNIPQEDLSARVVTTCQHIYALNYIAIFKYFGVTDLFFPHKLITYESVDGIRIYPFPLYPVQASRPDFKLKVGRKLLASFVGAFNCNAYLTDIRKHIFDLGDSDPRIRIIKRESWHYDRAVYSLQIQGAAGLYSEIEKERVNEEEYKALLEDSCFSLCPSGSGPNSIRLFEAMTYGSIPLILAQNLDLSYLHNEIRSMVFTDEDSLEGLTRAIEHARLESESNRATDKKADTLLRLRHTYEPVGYSEIIRTCLG